MKKPARTGYLVDVQGLKLLGGAIVINGHGSYKPKVRATPDNRNKGQSKQVDLVAKLQIDLSKGLPITLEAEYHVTTDRTWFLWVLK